MSQKKVDAYKDYKKNKKEILKKEKRVAKIEKGVVAAIIVVFIAWFGVSAYQMATRPKEGEETAVTATEVNMTDYVDYINGLSYGY
ncbi:MAG: hypothetical protein IJI04_03775 [Lachnospiraceae bacterium]|jgi:uncharacterized protein YpmB|nr:hypothetical protein [Lachnospiraceae bacterium]